MIAWSSILFGNFKTAIRALTLVTDSNGEIVRIWSLAFLAAFAGLSIGVFFLSFNYHYVYWIYTGMVGALAGVVTRHLPNFRIAITRKELGLLTFGGLLLQLLIFVYATYRLSHG
jgi:hypothetical protein